MTYTPASAEGILWRPPEDSSGGPMAQFLTAAARDQGVDLPDYRTALAWSIDDLPGFWDSVRRWFDLVGEWQGPVLADDRMPGASWFPQSRLNFAENVLRGVTPENASQTAIVSFNERGTRRELSWGELSRDVSAVAASLRRLGVLPGDRVAAVLPNAQEAIIALLASASIGATWCVCSPELSAPATVARLGQLQPAVLIGSLGYEYGGKWFDRRDHLNELVGLLPSVRHVVEVGDGATRMPFAELIAEPAEPAFERLPFDHPLWVLFTSGTTGPPKGIVHGHGGMTLEGVKAWGLHFELTPADRYFASANTSWMMWNTLFHALLTGASVVTYSGSPAYPERIGSSRSSPTRARRCWPRAPHTSSWSRMTRSPRSRTWTSAHCASC